MRLFKAYLEEYEGDMVAKEVAIEELGDALDSAECEKIE